MLAYFPLQSVPLPAVLAAVRGVYPLQRRRLAACLATKLLFPHLRRTAPCNGYNNCPSAVFITGFNEDA